MAEKKKFTKTLGSGLAFGLATIVAIAGYFGLTEVQQYAETAQQATTETCVAFLEANSGTLANNSGFIGLLEEFRWVLDEL